MPTDSQFLPTLTFQIMDTRRSGTKALAGTFITKSVNNYLLNAEKYAEFFIKDTRISTGIHGDNLPHMLQLRKIESYSISFWLGKKYLHRQRCFSAYLKMY